MYYLNSFLKSRQSPAFGTKTDWATWAELPNIDQEFKNFANKGNELLIYYKWKNVMNIIFGLIPDFIWIKSYDDFWWPQNLKGNL